MEEYKTKYRYRILKRFMCRPILVLQKSRIYHSVGSDIHDGGEPYEGWIDVDPAELLEMDSPALIMEKENG